MEKYVWLFVENGKMKCHPCLSIKQNNPFSTGCTHFRNSTLTRHQKSASHVEALRGVKLQSDIKKSIKKAETEKIKLQESSVKIKRHVVQLRTVYMAKNGISARNFEPLMKLQQVSGCPNLDDYYKKTEIVVEMETVLADQVSEFLLKDITSSPFIG